MKIYKIQQNIYIWEAYICHVIVANNEDEVRILAKNISAEEGKEIWETAEIEMFGHYSGDEKEPFIILSDLNA